MTSNILTVWVLGAAGIQLGTLWIMKLSILPMLNTLPYSRYVNACQLIDMHIFHPIAVWNGVLACAVGGILAITTSSGWAAAFFVAGSIGMAIVGITSEGFNRPIWRQIEKWNPDRTAPDWAEKRYRWHVAHQVRTYGAIGAVASYATAMILAA